MGLKNAPVQFQQMLDDRMEPVKDIADAYIDDVLDGTPGEVENQPDYDDLAQHNVDIRRVLDLFLKEGLIADIHKCKFFLPEVEWCGQIVGRGVRRPAPGRLMAIEKWEVPQSISELRAFFGV